MFDIFDQKKYQEEWTKQNMGRVQAKYKKEFVDEFKSACNSLGITQSEVFKKAMIETIEKANKLEK